MIEMKIAYCGLALALAVARAGAADVSEPVSAVVNTGWKYQITLDGWLAGLNGNIGLRDLPAAAVDVSPLDVFEDLDGVFAGSFQAVGDSWLLYTDAMWAKISTEADVGPLGGTAHFEQKQIVATALVGYELPLTVENMQLYATGGLRYQHNEVKLSIDPAFFPAVDRSGSQSWVDPIVGFTMHYDINNKWFMDVMADVGGFGVSSDITLQGTTTVGYNWTDTIASSFGYKALYTDYTDGGFRYEATQHGTFTRLAVKF
ncbi:hypothetical protein CES85_5440 [Ochrobactrum quorumnocens]|uniref:Outer membrane beta-barrel domain protein n=1 Tax=Ochrobactrum quorumnocens TaxID=271865 RepID=A0A248UD32_9HYPH|nr:hypothetical protein [[Ochrobactrum] quorumnocens]ASV84645.1 hypothetical protein CES85_5440 [[Ochrobactrum] quorumnocens]